MTCKDVAGRFGVCVESAYRYCNAAKKGGLTPKTRKSHPKKIDPLALILDVEKNPDSTLKQRAARFGAAQSSVWQRLVALGITQKKDAGLQGARRSRPLALCQVSRLVRTDPPNLLHRRIGHRPPPLRRARLVEERRPRDGKSFRFKNGPDKRHCGVGRRENNFPVHLSWKLRCGPSQLLARQPLAAFPDDKNRHRPR